MSKGGFTGLAWPATTAGLPARSLSCSSGYLPAARRASSSWVCSWVTTWVTKRRTGKEVAT